MRKPEKKARGWRLPVFMHRADDCPTGGCTLCLWTSNAATGWVSVAEVP